MKNNGCKKRVSQTSICRQQKKKREGNIDAINHQTFRERRQKPEKKKQTSRRWLLKPSAGHAYT
jgi:anti-anti-sigma regulatory factor